jgi:S-DNA-T family DNA segregation ATPase FtsK/SpoIIIE
MDTARVSVTEVRNALRCPRVFVLGRLRKSAVAFPVGSSCLGGAFHRIVERFAQTVTAPPEPFASLAAGAAAEVIRDALSRWILGFLVDELLRDPSYRAIPAEVDDLAEALRQFAFYLASRLGPGKPGDAIDQLVRAGEQAVEAEISEASVVLNGRIDALFRGDDGALDVVEYKLTDEANETLDRAQVVLYRELLRRSAGVDAKPVVLRFNPALSVHELPAARADALVREDLIPLLQRMNSWLATPESVPATLRSDLCAACPVAADCAERYPSRLPARDDPPMAASRPRPAAKGGLLPAKTVQPATSVGGDEDGEKEAAVIQRRIVEELRKDGIATTSDNPIVGPTVYVIHVARPRGSVAQLDSAARNVVHRLASTDGIEASYAKTGARREFTVKRRRPRTVLLSPLLEARKEWLSERPGRLVIGEQPDGTILTGDLADSATPHLLVGGQAGSGKSWLLRTLVASLVHWHGPSAIRITLLDPKRVTFNAGSFATAISAHLDGPILYGLEDAMPCIERYVEVMEERYVAFEREQVSDLHEYNQQVGRERWLPRHVIVIDEFQDLTAEKKAAAEFSGAVARLGAKARAAGVHMILATQRPDRQTVPPLLKANLGGKIALRVASAVNSRVILDDSGAENLLGKGDLFADLGQGLVRAQAAVLGT